MNSARPAAGDDRLFDLIRACDPLAAADPWPEDGRSLIPRIVANTEAARPPRVRSARRVRIAVVLAATVIAVPAVAFADTIGNALGISNQGTTVATSDTPLSSYPELNAAMQQLGLSTMQLLGVRDGISFYAARNPAGHFCFAFASPGGPGTGVGCRLDNAFPSPQDPLIDMFSTPQRLAGFADDDVAEIALLDADGYTIATVPVSGNIYALTDPPAGGTQVEALDANGNVIASHSIPQKP